MNYQGLVTDLYQLTMANALFKRNEHEKKVVFDRFYRKNPFDGAYTVVAGISHLIKFIKEFRYSKEDIEYLRSLNKFYPEFLDYLENFEFKGSIYAMQEGTIAFPKETLLRFHGTITEAMLLETGLAMIMNHESLIATKARRMRIAAKNDMLMEFGLRRAQGHSASLWGTRAAIIGGFNGTSHVEAGKLFGLPVMGTMAHSWVMSFDTELEAFREYARQYDENIILLVDTYNVLSGGIPNAVKVFKELRDENRLPKKYGIRIDSGDLAYLSKKAREIFDKEGFEDAIISASNDLDEYSIELLKAQGCTVTSWGVGTKVITADGTSALGGVFKMCEKETGNGFESVMKISNDVAKMTNPGVKNVRRFYKKKNGKIITDLMCLESEPMPKGEEFTFTTESANWRTKTLKKDSYIVEDMLKPIIINGKICKQPAFEETIEYSKSQMKSLWPEYTRFFMPHQMEINTSVLLQKKKKEIIKLELSRNSAVE